MREIALTENSSMKEITDYLLYHIDNADSRKSKTNPSFTKHQMWDFYMDIALKAKTNNERMIGTKHLFVKKLVKEFGGTYKKS